ncbi:MAG: Cys-tRNA(Pro) deacylase [Planctomycetota bacterium]
MTVARRGGGGTRATVALERAGVAFTVHPYEIPADASESSVGESAASALGVSADEVFKTLVAEVDGKPVCGLVPVSGTLSLKALAKAAGGKRARMAESSDAERLTGYVTGGISPFGQLRSLPTYVDASASAHDAIYVSAGRRGLQLRVSPDDLLTQTRASSVEGLAAG